MTTEKMKKLWIILTVGIILRVVLSLTTYHSDMAVFDLAGRLVASGNILNLYDFSSAEAVLNYPPPIYLLHGLFRFLLGGIFILPFLKIPYLIFDLLTGFILWKLFDSPKKSLLALAFWMFNPISLYATYTMGQFDIIPTFFIVLSIYLAVRSKLEWVVLALGAGIAFKIFPIFLVIPLAIFGKDFWGKIKLVIFSMMPYFLSIVPYLGSASFKATALFANQSSKSLYANIPVSGGESIILFPAFLIFFYLLIWHLKIRFDLWKLYLIPLLLFFIFTHFHPQWLIWITPLLILEMIRSEFKNILSYLLILISWFGSLFFFDPSLTVGLFSPILPVLQDSPGIWVLMNLNPDYNLWRSILQTIFVAAAIYLIYDYFPRKTNA